MDKKFTKFIEEQSLFRRYARFIKTFWLNLVLIIIFSFFNMVLMQIMVRAAYISKTLIFIFGFLSVFIIFGTCISFSIRLIRKAQFKNIFEEDVSLLVFFTILFISCVLFMVLFLIFNQFAQKLWFLKSTFYGIMLMIFHWSTLAVLLLPNKLSRNFANKIN